jgi:hypothetical protein
MKNKLTIVQLANQNTIAVVNRCLSSSKLTLSEQDIYALTKWYLAFNKEVELIQSRAQEIGDDAVKQKSLSDTIIEIDSLDYNLIKGSIENPIQLAALMPLLNNLPS